MQLQAFLDFRGFDFRDFQFTLVYNSILFSSLLVLRSNLDLGVFFCIPTFKQLRSKNACIAIFVATKHVLCNLDDVLQIIAFLGRYTHCAIKTRLQSGAPRRQRQTHMSHFWPTHSHYYLVQGE